MNGQIKRGQSRRKASHKIAHFCHKKWKKCCAAALCVTVAASNLTGTFSAEAKSDTYNFELSRESLDEALQEALYDGATVTEEDFIFEGSSADDYVSLMNTDTALYELKPEIKENDEDLVLRVFARVDGDLVTNEDFTNEVYELNEEDEIIFLLENRSAEEQKAVIQVDDRTSEVITVMPAGKIQVETDGPGGADSAEKATDPAEGGPGVIDGGSGNGGGGGGSTPAPEVPEEPSSEAPTEESTEESTEAGSEETTAPEESDPSETTEAEEPTQPADPTDSTDAPEESEDSGSGDTTTDPSEDAGDNEGNAPDDGDGSDTGTDPGTDGGQETGTDGGSTSDTDTGSSTDEGTDTGNDSGSEAGSSDTSTGGDTSSDSGSQSSDTSDSSDSEGSSDTSGEGASMASISLREFRLVATAAGTETTEAAESTEAADTETEESKEEESKAEETLESEEETSEETTASDETKAPEETTASDETKAPEETTAAEETTAPEETSEAGGDSEVVVEEPDTATSSEADKDDAEEATPSEASPSEADKNSIEGDIYEAVKVGDYAVVAFATTAGEVGLTELPPEIFAKELKDVTVEAVAERGVFPIGTTMDVMALGEDTAEYENAKEALKAEGTESTGMLAYDISFKNMAGEEIEPAGEVNVSIRLSTDLLPEDADLDSLTVHHMAEEGSSTIKAEAVADVGTETSGTVEVVQEEAIAAFSVESFSTFTITWNKDGSTSGKFSVVQKFRNTNSEEYQENPDLKPSFPNGSLTVAKDNVVRFTSDNELFAVEGYELTEAKMYYRTSEWWQTEIIGSCSIYEFEASVDNNSCFYKEKASDTETKDIGSSKIKRFELLYTKISETNNPLVIENTIAETGAITAKYNNAPIDLSKYYCRWYKGNPGQLVPTKTKDSIDVYIDGADETYYVELWELDGTSSSYVAKSEPFSVPYFNKLQNGSFEDPVSDVTMTQYTNGLYPEMVWKTTGPGTGNRVGQDIEILNTTGTNNPYNGWGTAKAAEGDQFAELNCEAMGTLYQDVLTIPGTPLYWSVSHRARWNSGHATLSPEAKDTMCVIIMDAQDAENYVKDQSAVTEISSAAQSKGATADNGVEVTVDLNGHNVTATVWIITSSAEMESGWENQNGIWFKYKDDYKVKSEQYLTRFLFGAVTTASKNNTIGNLLDDVSFSQDPPIVDNEVSLTIKKNIVGIDAETEVKKDTFKFQVKNVVTGAVKEVFLPTLDATSDQSTLWNISVTGLDAGLYEVKEISPTAELLNTYKYIDTIVQREGEEPKKDLTTGQHTIEEGTVETVTFTNNYEKAEATLSVSKTVTGNMGDITKDFEFVLSLTKDNTPYKEPLKYVGYIGKDQRDTGELIYDSEKKGYVFKLKDEKDNTITVPSGYSWKVEELDNEYTTTIHTESDLSDTSRKSIEGTASGDISISFLNEKEIQTPTGITTDILPYGLMLAVGALGATGFKLKGRRKDDDD